MSKITKLHMTV